MAVYKMLGNNIKELRKSKRMTQKDLAEVMNVSQQTVGAWETGRAIPGSDTLDILADFFDVSTDYLLKDDTEEEKSNNTSTNKHHFSLSWVQFGQLNSAIWAIAGGIYAICGFGFDNWNSGMIIFPITLILTVIIRLFAH